MKKFDLTTNWTYAADGRINSQIAVDRDDNVYFSTENGKIYSLNKDGNLNWKMEAGITSAISPVLVKNGVIWGYGSKVVLIKK